MDYTGDMMISNAIKTTDINVEVRNDAEDSQPN